MAIVRVGGTTAINLRTVVVKVDLTHELALGVRVGEVLLYAVNQKVIYERCSWEVSRHGCGRAD